MFRNNSPGKRRQSVPTSTLRDITYRDVRILARFLTPQGRMLSRLVTGLSRKQHSKVTKNIKRARNAGIL